MPTSAAGTTPVSRVQNKNSTSLRFYFAGRSGRSETNTVNGRATNMNTTATNRAGPAIRASAATSTWLSNITKMGLHAKL